MNTSRLLLAVLSSTFASLLLAPSVFAQGALTPPGAPAPMFKTLDQIEARKPLGTPNVVTTSTIVISEPGSYVLVGAITVAGGNGITINTSNVTLDLNGFTISSTAATDDGSAAIKINGDGTNVTNVTVRNGIIFGAYTVASNGTASGAGFTNGIYCYLSNASNVSVSHISVCGVRGYGIYLSDFDNINIGNVDNSQCIFAGSGGLYAAIVEQCSVSKLAAGSFNAGINANQVVNCSVNAGAAGEGIQASTVLNSSAVGKYIGIYAFAVSNCEGSALDSSNNSYGIFADTVINSAGTGGSGIRAYSTVTNSNGTSTSNTGASIGINCPDGTVSFSQGDALLGGSNRSIVAKIAVACTSSAGRAPIQSPSPQLGTVAIP